MLKIGLIGFGYWGPNVARNLMSLPNAQFSIIIDPSNNSVEKAKKLFPNIKTSSNINEGLNEADAFVVATPIHTHFPIAKKLLENGKHILLQKPMAGSSKECKKLIELSKKYDKKIMVAHTFLFSPSIKRMKQDLEDKTYGELNYISSSRINLGLFQRSHNVIWDLAPHDFSIIRHLYSEKPKFISAIGRSHTNSKLVDCANITIGYNTDFIAMIHLNWLSPIKVRNMIVCGTKKMVVYDDNSSEKIKIYDAGVSYNEDVFTYRKGDIFTPKLDEKEAIYYECFEFVDSLISKRECISNMSFGLEIVQMIEAANKSIEQDGKPVLL